MGVKNLFKLLSTAPSSCWKTTTVNDYIGKTVALDSNHEVYTLWSVGYSLKLKTSTGRASHHITGLWSKWCKLREAGISDIYWVFDGKAPIEKERTREERKSRGVVRPDDYIFSESRDFLYLIGATVVKAPGEGEKECVRLADYVISGDSDVLAHKSKYLLKRQAGRGQGDFIQYDLKGILEYYELTMIQFIYLCILLGTDYNKPIVSSPQLALSLIKEHRSLDSRGLPQRVQDRLREINWRGIVALYINRDDDHPIRYRKQLKSEADIADVRLFLTSRGFDPRFVTRVVNKLREFNRIAPAAPVYIRNIRN